MSSRHRTVDSNSNTPAENKNDEHFNHTENNTQSLLGDKSVEPNLNPIENTQQNTLQIPDSSYSEMFTGQRHNPFVKLQQQFSEVFSAKQTQTENERLWLQHQRRIKAANQLLRQQDLERNQLIQQLNQPDTNPTWQCYSGKCGNNYFNNKKVPPQQVEKSGFSSPTPFVFLVLTERQKQAIFTHANSFTENSTNSLLNKFWLKNTVTLIYILRPL